MIYYKSKWSKGRSIGGFGRVNFSKSDKIYVAIDLKSFYASVECVERNFDPLSTNLVVADNSRTDKTICLAVSPSLKAYGIPGRARLFEVKQRVKEVNARRLSEYRRLLKECPERFDRDSIPPEDFQKPWRADFVGESFNPSALEEHPELALGFVTADPRMALYMEYSTRIYDIYLKYVAPEDIHIYSVDEVFMDVTNYLKLYGLSAHDLTIKMIRHVLSETGITATAGIGTNMYLAKIAMDIEAKHIAPDSDGVRIAELDEMSYRKSLWEHQPITDFWRVGKGYAKRLASCGIYTMGDVARCSIGSERDFHNEDLLYKLFGVNAELLIDHAWGWEPCTIKEIKDYRPESNSINVGQVLQNPYTYEKARLIVKEMADNLALDLVRKGIVCNQVTLTVGYDIENLEDPEREAKYKGEITIDYYGRAVPKHAHGTANLDGYSASSAMLRKALLSIFDRTVNVDLTVRRITISANNVVSEKTRAESENEPLQLDLFSGIAALDDKGSGIAALDDKGEDQKISEKELEEEAKIQETLLAIKKKFGKNAVVKAMNLEEGATAISRNKQIGGHKA